MKIAYGLSALLLGTTLLAGAAAAQDNNGNNPPPHADRAASGPPQGFSGPPGGYHGAPSQNAFGRPNPYAGHGNAGHANAFHAGGANQARWNHVVTFHDRNVAHFNAQDRAMWAHGQWRHTRHNGRNGWWWYTNGAWFFYDEPTYPYPDYVSDNYSFDEDYADAPDEGSGYVWYYCNNPPGYYPYVQSCRGPWQPVTPTPPGSAYDQGPQGGPDQDQNDDDQGPPPGPQDRYQGGPNTPPPGYDNGDDDDDQGPPPPGYNDQGPQGYGPPPGYNDQPPPR